MIISRWDDLPKEMKNSQVKDYYDFLLKKKVYLVFKRLFDFFISLIMLILLFLPMAIIAAAIKLDSDGPVFYRQERVTTYNKIFKIHKFRTMVDNADLIGDSVTSHNDNRITKIGKKIRDLRIDELPQLIDVLVGNMSFVGTRPEAIKFVKQYKPEYYATLLLPAGITSETSIAYKDEGRLIDQSNNPDQTYVEDILPEKMAINLQSIYKVGILYDIKIMIMTVLSVFFKKD